MRVIRKNGIGFFEAEVLKKDGLTTHAFLLRTGGVSKAPFNSLNLDIKTGDKTENIEGNKGRVSRAFGFEKNSLIHVKQVHGDLVAVIEKKGAPASTPRGTYESIEADAIITSRRGMAIGILTADCLPVMLYDPVKKAIGAVHAGWRGTIKGVVTRAIEEMTKKFGTSPENLIAAMGPSIGPCCYTVGKEVIEECKKTFGNAGKEFIKEGRHPAIDISGLNGLLLARAGVKKENMAKLSVCTSCRNDILFSYRKDGKITGRQMSFIMLRGEG